MNDKDFVSLDVAKLLKDKGFDEDCVACYLGDRLFYIPSNVRGSDIEIIGQVSRSYKDMTILAPVLSQAMRWLATKYKVCIFVSLSKSGDTYISLITKWGDIPMNDFKEYETYSEALNEGMKKALQTL